MIRGGASCLISILLGSVLGCASSEPPPPKTRAPSEVVNGIRQRPLTAEEVEAAVRSNRPRVADCYTRERLNAQGGLSDFVFQLKIPADGSKQKVTKVSATIEGQIVLESCIADVLSAIHFPAHNGEALTINVPIQGPR